MDKPIQSTIPQECQDEDPSAVEFNLECAIHCLDWADEKCLAFGHDLGVGMLEKTEAEVIMPTEIQREWTFKKMYFHLGKQANIVCAQGGVLAAAHPDNSITVVKDGQTHELGGTRGHSDRINAIDISSRGVIASTGHDRYVLIWEDAHPKGFRLGGLGQKVKFWNDSDSDKLIVLESNDKIRLLDWRKDQWLLTIYPGKPVHDIGVVGGEVVAVGEGWWKRFNIASLVGGCGHTPATDEGRLMISSAGGRATLNNVRAAYANHNELDIYDLSNSSEHGSQLIINDRQVDAIAVNGECETLAIASGTSLILYSPRAQVVFS